MTQQPEIDSNLPFQERVRPWLVECFGEVFDLPEHQREARFLEEAIELFQARGRTFEELISVAKYVFERPVGDAFQEVGGVMTTLAALCYASDINMQEAGDVELARIWTKVDQIREKQLRKPKHSPLPGSDTADAVPENNWEPTDAQIHSVCLSMAHDYGLMKPDDQKRMQLEAKWWLQAWLKEMPKTPSLRTIKAPTP